MAGLLSSLETSLLDELEGGRPDPEIARGFRRPSKVETGPSLTDSAIARDERRSTMTESARAAEQKSFDRGIDAGRAAGVRADQDLYEANGRANLGWKENAKRNLQNLPERAKSWIGGLGEAFGELGALANPDTMTQTFGSPTTQADLDEERARGVIPGQQLNEGAQRAMSENAPNYGNSKFQMYVMEAGNSAVELAAAVGASVATGTPTTGAALMGARVFGDKYAQSRSEGRSTLSAFQDASFYAMAESLGERFAIGKFLEPGKGIAKNIAKGAVAEGMQEAFTQVLQTGYDVGVLDVNMSMGEATQAVIDAGIIGAIAGGPVGAFSPRGEKEEVTKPVTPEDIVNRVAEGYQPGAAFETSVTINSQTATTKPSGLLDSIGQTAAMPTQADIDSPIPTELITGGKSALETALATEKVNQTLEASGLPAVGKRVAITMPDGRQMLGTLNDVFEGAADAPGSGVSVKLDNGREFKEYLDDMQSAGVRLEAVDDIISGKNRPMETEEDAPAAVTPPPASGDVAQGFMGKVRGAESSGDDGATNSKSSATGRYQFIDKTWLAYHKRAFPEAMSDAQRLAQRGDGKVQDRLMADLTRDNQRALEKAGVPITEGNLYLAHFAGEAGARALHRADPAASAESVLGSDAVDANPFLKRMSASQVIAWAAGKMGGQAPAATESAGSDAPSPAAEAPIEDNSQDILDAPLISAQQPAAQIAPIPAEPTTQAEPAAAVGPTFKDTVGGKGFVLSGATPAQLDAIRKALPKIDIPMNKNGDATFSKKREAEVRSIIDASLLEQSSNEGTRAAPVVVEAAGDIERAAVQVAEPTEAQKEAGNYRKAHVRVQGLDISIENPKGSERAGTDANGRPWSVTMPDHYGYVKRTMGADGDNVDVYVGPEPQAETVFVVDQADADTGKFDEAKAMMGYPSQEAALDSYRGAFSDGRGDERIFNVTPMSIGQFKEWLKGDTTKPVSETFENAQEPDQRDARAVANADVQAVDQYQGSADQSEKPVLPQLRRARDQDASAVDGIVRDVRGSNPATSQPGALAGSDRQQRPLRAGQPALGDEAGASAQPAQEPDADTQGRDAGDIAVGEGGGAASVNAPLSSGNRDDGGRGSDDTTSRGQEPAGRVSKIDELADRARRGLKREADGAPNSALQVAADIRKARNFEQIGRDEFEQIVSETAGVSDKDMLASIVARHTVKISGTLSGGMSVEDAAAAARASEKPKVSANRLVTDERADELRKRLKAKLSGAQLNAGVDPEILALGMELSVHYIEKGARTFAAYAKAMIDDLGDAARPFLRSWYEAARYYPGNDATGMSGPEDIGAALASLERDRGNQGGISDGDAGASAGNVQRAAEDGRAGSAPADEGGRGSADAEAVDRAPAETAERSGARPSGAESSRGTGASSADRVPAAEPADGRGRGDDTRASDAQRVTGQNWSIAPGSLDEARSAAVKARDNLRAVEIVKELDGTGKPATRDQQEALAKYVGWGGLKNAFNETNGAFPKGFETIGPRLKELLTETEYDTARRSIQYAHYTAEKVVRPMWDAAVRLGFKGGKVFEPGMGTGNFLGMMPADVAANTQYAGLEFDYITARIAQLLYPQSGIQHADFTKAPLAKNAYDLVIGNPPFSQTVIRSDPEYGKLGFVLHDFFFAKSLDAVRPGGLLMFVTSAGTMNKVGTEARAFMAERADLVGAVRLAGDAFKENAGTEVTTDIIILRKRLPGEAAGDAAWVDTVEQELTNREGGKTNSAVSAYFNANPDMVLGEEGLFDTLAAGERYGVRARPGQDTGKELAKALDTLPVNVMADWQADAETRDLDFASDEKKDGSFYIAEDGRLMQQRAGVGVPVEGRGKGVAGGIPAKDQERIRALVPIRDALRDVFRYDLAGSKVEGDAARKVLNGAYDRFVQKYGPINKADISFRRPTVIQQESARNQVREEVRLQGGFFEEGSFDPSEMIRNKARTSEIAAARREAKAAAEAMGREWDEGSFDPAEDMPDVVIVKRPNIDAFMDDQEGYRLRAIEHYNDESGEGKKGAIFFENIVSKDRAPEIKGANDALLYVLNRSGTPDIDQIAALAKISRGQVLEELSGKIFRVPDMGETYETREKYLSGNVRKKLATAKAAAERDPAFTPNVEALENVQPEPLGPADIVANLGMPWIPEKTIVEFADSLGLGKITARYRPALAQWSVDGNRNSAAARSEWGTSDKDAIELLGNALNRQNPKVNKKVRDPETGKEKDVINPETTQAAQDKVAQIKEKFAEWVWQDTARTDELAGIYNRDYNNLVAPSYDGAYLTTPGIATHWSWRPHQTRVIARIIQAGNTYMAHAVGAGKTSAMIGAGMEMRRLGLVRKPMYAVPNHMLGQFTKEFYEQYPTAKIMVADERQFHTDRRKQFIANVASTDLDAVIITHSAFGYIPLSDEFMDQLLEKQIADFRSMLDEMKAEASGGRGDRFTVRNIEQQIESMQQRLSGKAKGKKDQVFTFEETGVDFLFVDEAHLFRKLDFATKMNNVRGIDSNGSQMSYDLFAKTRYLESLTPNRSHVLASGTAITNTMAELYSLSRYQQPQELADRGLSAFDAWAGAFGDTVTALEQDPAGGYKPQTRFAKFVNVPELSAMVRQVMDVVTSKQLEQYVVRPKLKGGRREMVLAQPGDELMSYQEALGRRMAAIAKRSGPPKKGDDILLSVIGDGRKAAIDMRLVDAGLTRDEGSKLELMIERVSKIARDTADVGFHRVEGDGYAAKPYRRGAATQMIFSDLGINGDFQIHKYIAGELARRGLPRDQIAIISDYKSHVARQRLFNDMNEGKVRVLIGSVPKMGTGVNAQRQLYAIHNMDPQWYPANDEQRNGRGLRQGNENPEIEIIDYSTKGTYDSTMWGMMESKARFIEGFFSGDPTMRSMDDLGEASQYEQAKAITTADPRILEMTGYKQDLERALLRKAGFEREQYSLRNRITESRESIDRSEKRIPNLRKDIEQRQDITGDNFKGKVGQAEFTERAEFGEAVMNRVEETAELGLSVRDKKIAEIGGFEIVLDVTVYGRDKSWNIYLQYNGGRQERISASTPAGIATSVASQLRGLETLVEREQDGIARNQKQIDDFTPQLDRTFTGQAEIDELAGKVSEIEGQLTREAAAKDAAPKAQRMTPPDVLTGEEGSKSFPYAPAAIREKLTAELQRVGLIGKVELEAGFDLFENPLQGGEYADGKIKVQLGTDGTTPTFTLNHEIIHAMQARNIFKRDEWTAMKSEVLRDAALMATVRQRYPELNETAQAEEAIADRYAAWREGRIQPRGFMRSAFDRLQSFLTALYRAARGIDGAYERVFEAIEAGEIGAREPGSGRRVTVGPLRSIVGSNADPDPETVSEALASAGTLRASLGENFDAWRTGMQDRMLPLMRVKAAVEKVLGRTIKAEENPYIGEELMSGRIGAQLDNLADNMVSPMFEAMKAEKITPEELESYLYARHAPERNAEIDKINPEMDGRGSGMSDIEAAAIMQRIEDDGRTKQFESVAKYIDGILRFARDTRFEAGLLSQDQVDAWEGAYKYYVPLRGFAELDNGSETPRQGQGITVRGAESKRAFGRRSKAEDIIAYSIMQAEEAIIRGQKNMVARQLYDLAKATPDPNFWIPNKVTMKRKIDPNTGLVNMVPDRTLTAEDAPFTVSLKIDGKEKRLTVNRANPTAVKLAESMRRLDETQANKLIQVLSSINRWLSAANTSLVPEFVITNMFRDVQTALINLSAEEQKGLITGVVKDYRKAMAGSMRGAFDKEDGEWGRWYREFVEAGGKVAFNQINDIGALRKNIERQFASMQQKNLTPATAALKAWGGIKAVYSVIEKVNDGVENAVRLAVFKNAREKGMSPTEAASLAKNITVNFNRRGSYGVAMNAFFLFYNAAVQGSTRILIASRNPKVQKILLGIVVASAAIDMLNVMLSADDDDGELYYDKISDFDKSRNLVIMNPFDGKSHFKIPMPYGYNAFAHIGRAGVELGRGKDFWTTVSSLGGTIVDAFNPVGGTQSLLNFIAPTVVDPIVDLWRNRDFADRPIMPDQPQYGSPTPDNQRYWGSVNPLWKGITDTLNKVSGGDDIMPGAVDVSPETLEYMFGVVAGSAGAFYDRTMGLGLKSFGVATGDPEASIERNDIPFVRKLVGEKAGWYDKAALYSRMAQVEQALDYAKGYVEKGDQEGFNAFMAKNLDVVSLESNLKRTKKHMRELRKERRGLDKAKEMGTLDAAGYKEKMTVLKGIEEKVITEFNSTYLKTVKVPVGPS